MRKLKRLAAVKVPPSAKGTTYRCRACGKLVQATALDPIAVVTRGTFHVGCLLRLAAVERFGTE